MTILYLYVTPTLNEKTAAMVVMAAILVSGLVLVSALGNSAYAQQGKEAKVEIVKSAANMVDKVFAPNPIKVKAGDKVTWKNVDTAAHTMTFGKPSDKDAGKMFDSKLMAPKKEFSFKFDKNGTYDYFCQLRPAMVGQVVVQ